MLTTSFFASFSSSVNTATSPLQCSWDDVRSNSVNFCIQEFSQGGGGGGVLCFAGGSHGLCLYMHSGWWWSGACNLINSCGENLNIYIYFITFIFPLISILTGANVVDPKTSRKTIKSIFLVISIYLAQLTNKLQEKI